MEKLKKIKKIRIGDEYLFMDDLTWEEQEVIYNSLGKGELYKELTLRKERTQKLFR